VREVDDARDAEDQPSGPAATRNRDEALAETVAAPGQQQVIPCAVVRQPAEGSGRTVRRLRTTALRRAGTARRRHSANRPWPPCRCVSTVRANEGAHGGLVVDGAEGNVAEGRCRS
jgi:hypothetical protein